MPMLRLATKILVGLTIGPKLTTDSEPARGIYVQTRKGNPKSLVVSLV